MTKYLHIIKCQKCQLQTHSTSRILIHALSKCKLSELQTVRTLQTKAKYETPLSIRKNVTTSFCPHCPLIYIF